MRNAEWVNLVYFTAMILLAGIRKLPRTSLLKALALGIAGLALTLSMPFSPPWVRNWLPVLLMPMAYWQSGCFFQSPNTKLQAVFDDWDGRLLGFLRSTKGAPWLERWILPLLELTYLLCYPVVPLGVAALYAAGRPERAADYWFVVLVATYPCYLLLVWMPMLPPRLLEGGGRLPPHPGKMRRFNLWLVRGVTHQATTFPSGHVAASVAIALVLLELAPVYGIVFSFIALGIALGCIAGRYHYALDVLAAIVLALVAFILGS